MSDEDKKPKKPLNRRSFMATVVGGAAVVGGASALIAGEAKAQQRPTGRSDSDTGNGADRGGYGRTGVSDSDQKRTIQGLQKEVTSIAFVADTPRAIVSAGDNTVRLYNTDSGGNADAGGNGRGATRSTRSGLTDSDSGSAADDAGYGRGPRRG